MNQGFHSIRLGNVEITGLHDGFLHGSMAIITGVDEDTATTTLTRHFRAVPPVIGITTFLLRDANGLTLIDAGTGSKMGPEIGKVVQQMAAMGISPGNIGRIILTHVHSDHAGGLTDANGRAVFANAELVLPVEERDFWLDPNREWPERLQKSRNLAIGTLTPYLDRMRTVGDGQEGAPGITRMAFPGHTPGHSGWMLSSGACSMLFWGDIVHLPGLQFTRPDATMIYDIDPAMAEASRRRAMDIAATDRLHIAGPHVDFPGFGHVERRVEGFGFVPDMWTP